MEYSERDNQRRLELAECLLGLFEIMTTDSKMDFVNALHPMGNGTIGDIVRGATFIQLAQLTRSLGVAKFTQDPHPLIERMKQVMTPTKEEQEERERRREAFVNSLIPPIF